MNKDAGKVKGFFLYFDQCEPLADLTDEQCGQLLKGMVAKFQGEDFNFTDPTVKIIFKFFENTVKRDAEKYINKCERLRENALAKKQMQANATKCKQNKANASKSIQQQEQEQEYKQEQNIKYTVRDKRGVFVPPTVEQVQAHIVEKGYAVNADEFVTYYEARGWVMSGNVKMKKWKATLAQWNARAKKQGQARITASRPAPPGQFYMNRQRDIAQKILADMEAEDNATRCNTGQTTQASGFDGNGSELRQGITSGAW